MTWRPIDEKALADARTLLKEDADVFFSCNVAGPNLDTLDDGDREIWERYQRAIATIDGILNGEDVPEPVYAWAVNLTGWAGIFYMDRESAESECATRNFGRDHAKYCVVRVRIEEAGDE